MSRFEKSVSTRTIHQNVGMYIKVYWVVEGSLDEPVAWYVFILKL